MGRRSVWIKSQLDYSGRHSRLNSRIDIFPLPGCFIYFLLIPFWGEENISKHLQGSLDLLTLLRLQLLQEEQ